VGKGERGNGTPNLLLRHVIKRRGGKSGTTLLTYQRDTNQEKKSHPGGRKILAADRERGRSLDKLENSMESLKKN